MAANHTKHYKKYSIEEIKSGKFYVIGHENNKKKRLKKYDTVSEAQNAMTKMELKSKVFFSLVESFQQALINEKTKFIYQSVNFDQIIKEALSFLEKNCKNKYTMLNFSNKLNALHAQSRFESKINKLVLK